MKTLRISAFFMAAALLAGCQLEPDVKVYASFTTEKDVYEINEDIHITNTSYAENAKIVACKWEWGQNHKWGIQMEEPISFERVGEYEITLTAVSDVNNISGTFVKTLTIQDTNIRPVADFSWEPQDGIRAGDAVKFTDKSTDADGSIVGWEWTFGSTVVTEQNPEFKFSEFGDIEVSLTVTDNMKGKNTKTVTIHVDRSEFSLELLWSQPYETKTDAYVKYTSPSTNADGSMVYAFSSGYTLAAFDKDGNKQWSFDANKHNPNPLSSKGSMQTSSCIPSVDSEGNVFIAVGYNEGGKKAEDGYDSGVYSISSSGSENWYFSFERARYMVPLPVVLGDYLVLTTKDNPNSYEPLKTQYGYIDNGHILDRKTGKFVQTLRVKQGNHGGVIGFKDMTIIGHCNTNYGSRIWFYEDGTWNHYGSNDQDLKSLGFYNSKFEAGNSSQMAVSNDGNLVYILYANNTKRISGTSLLYCYDRTKYVKDKTTAYEPEWVVAIKGSTARYEGVGAVVGEDGTIYVSTKTTGEEIARVTAVTPSGSVKWESLADGDITGTPAIDNEGYIYYNDYSNGKVVKLNPVDGKKIAEITVADELRSSPTISADGTIYCTGMKDNIPTLFAVKGSATGHANSWSQLGGNPSKTCVLY